MIQENKLQTITISLCLTESLTGVPVLTDEYLGSRVLVQWYGGRTYIGTFDKMSSSGQYHITYDDGDERNYTLQRSVHGDLFALNRERTDDIHRFIIQDNVSMFQFLFKIQCRCRTN